MRIDAFSQIMQTYRPAQPVKTKQTDWTSTLRDQVEISPKGKDFQIAKRAVAEASDIREDKVAEMKEKYSGDFEVDIEDFASALLGRAAAGF